jgi:F0F1-type ATP synthase assembly protein I
VAESNGKKRFAVGPYMNLGMQLAIAVICGTAVGYWLDSKIHSSPIFLLIGLFMGSAAGFLTIYRTVYPIRKDKQSDRNP